jgi:Rieske Fe-S protein
MTFTLGAVSRVLIHRDGRNHGLSRACTHMGCLPDYKERGVLQCPCHGAQFTLDGASKVVPHGYDRKLPDLPRLRVRVRSSSVQVFTIF